ncbi:MAG: GNAT family N-acetyltransferase [Thermoplasmata archaeon]
MYEDMDDMDWLQYLICVDRCIEVGIESIANLEDRVVPEEEFRRLWLDRCKQMHQEDIFKCVHVEEESDPSKKSEICECILRSLPQWFGIDKAVIDYIEGVKDKLFLTAYVKSIPVGFISIKEHNEYTSEIYVMGIVEELHGRDIGKRLFGAVEKRSREQGKKFISVKTLSGSHPDENYKRTRYFYRSLGFYPLEEVTTLWGEDNPCLVMVKPLR